MIILSMILLMAVISLIAISSMRMAMLQSRASDAFGNQVQALQAADIAIGYCDELVRTSIVSGSSRADSETQVLRQLPDTWADPRRWEVGAPGYIEVPFAEHNLAVPPRCLIDESATQFVVTARGFSPNYVRSNTKKSGPAKDTNPGSGASPDAAVDEFDGAEVWLQSVTVKPAAGIKANGATTLNHSWRQIVTFPS